MFHLLGTESNADRASTPSELDRVGNVFLLFSTKHIDKLSRSALNVVETVFVGSVERIAGRKHARGAFL